MVFEKVPHHEAFEMYYLMGDSRSMGKVARKIGRDQRTIQRWRNRYDWERRIEERDSYIYDSLNSLNAEEIIEAKVEYAGAIREMIKKQIIDVVNAGDDPFPIDDARKFTELIKVYLLLMGDPTSRSESKRKVEVEPVLSVEEKIKERARYYNKLYNADSGGEESAGSNSI